MEAAEWAERKVEQIEGKRAIDTLRDQLSLKRQQLRESHFPELVKSLVQAFCAFCKEYNNRRPQSERSIEFHVNRGRATLKRDAGWSEMWVESNSATQVIRITAHRCDFSFDRTYRPEPLADGAVVLACHNDQSLGTPDDVAQTAIDAFLDGRELGERM